MYWIEKGLDLALSCRLLTLTFLAADPPYIVAAEDAAVYLKNKGLILVPPSMHTPMEGNVFRRYQEKMKRKGFQNETLVKEWSALYYGMVTQVDTWVGELMDELELQQVAQNTLGKCADMRVKWNNVSCFH